jgi:hypothetical protein
VEQQGIQQQLTTLIDNHPTATDKQRTTISSTTTLHGATANHDALQRCEPSQRDLPGVRSRGELPAALILVLLKIRVAMPR